MPRDERNANIRSILRIGDLWVSSADDAETLRVPLQVVDESHDPSAASVRLYEGGVVWEDMPYNVGFDIRTNAPVRRATLSINDHGELYMRSTFKTMNAARARGKEYRCRFVVDKAQANDTARRPFIFTCGFARVEARIEFFDGPDVHLCTPDIVSLNEPQTIDGFDERAEEKNVRGMYRALIEAEGNQAAEWMFARGPVSLVYGRLSVDKDTDWAYAPISIPLQMASEALDCVYDGLESADDEFPTSCAVDGGRIGPHDTDENRAVRALLASMEEQVRRTRDVVQRMYVETEWQRVALRNLVDAESARRHCRQSLPALEILHVHSHRERELLEVAQDLLERTEEMLELFDDEADGVGAVAHVPFAVPRQAGVFVRDPTYAQLHASMRTWAVCANENPSRMDLSLHAIKPDKLFEYRALHRMLDWLWRHGFREDESFDKPIDRYRYLLEDWYHKYENEDRCANTYHLAREGSDGDAERVDLYFQPVLYASALEENGVDVHRVPRRVRRPNEEDADFWTPDYLLVVRRDGSRKTYLIDAKYCAHGLLHRKMTDCVDKYVARSAVCLSAAGTGIDGVALLAGRLDAPPLDASTNLLGDVTYLRVLAPFNQRTDDAVLTRFFAALGIE